MTRVTDHEYFGKGEEGSEDRQYNVGSSAEDDQGRPIHLACELFPFTVDDGEALEQWI